MYVLPDISVYSTMQEQARTNLPAFSALLPSGFAPTHAIQPPVGVCVVLCAFRSVFLCACQERMTHVCY